MDGSVEIREVVVADVPAVVDFVRRVLAEFGIAFGDGAPTDTQLEDLPASYAEAGGRFWVAVREGRILGTAGVHPVPEHAAFELRKMYLAPDVRGLGLGKRLFDVALAHARARGAARMVLDTTERMTRAIAFYESHGFVRDDRFRTASRCTRGYVKTL